LQVAIRRCPALDSVAVRPAVRCQGRRAGDAVPAMVDATGLIARSAE